LDDKDEHVKA